mgnify:CR=1 FL=1
MSSVVITGNGTAAVKITVTPVAGNFTNDATYVLDGTLANGTLTWVATAGTCTTENLC